MAAAAKAGAGAGTPPPPPASWGFGDLSKDVKAAWTNMKFAFFQIADNMHPSGLRLNIGTYPILFMLGLLLLFVSVIIWYIIKVRFLATTRNIARILNEHVNAEMHYV